MILFVEEEPITCGQRVNPIELSLRGDCTSSSSRVVWSNVRPLRFLVWQRLLNGSSQRSGMIFMRFACVALCTSSKHGCERKWEESRREQEPGRCEYLTPTKASVILGQEVFPD